MSVEPDSDDGQETSEPTYMADVLSNGDVEVTNQNTGESATVYLNNLGEARCTCAAFKYDSSVEECDHLRMVTENHFENVTWPAAPK